MKCITTRRSRRALATSSLAALAVAAAGTLAAGPASASTTRLTNGADYNGAYYYSAPSNGLASVSTTFKVPTINCSQGLQQGQAFGVYTLVPGQAWTDVAVADTYCYGTTPTYKLVVEAGNNDFVEPGVSPGDTVVASAFQTASGYDQATVHDLTSNYTWSAGSYGAAATAAQIGSYNLDYNFYLDAPFTTVTFTKTQVNGDYLGFQSPVAVDWTYGQYNTVIVKTGALASNSDTFKLTWKAD